MGFEDHKIGIMWSNQTDSAMYLAYHRDGDPNGTWTASHTFDAGTGAPFITRHTGIVVLAPSETTTFSYSHELIP